MKSIAERLRFVREKMGIGQVDAATKFGIPVSSYRKYESGPSEPGSEAIAGIARAGINANWLLTGEGEMLLSDVQPRPAPPVDPFEFNEPLYLEAIRAVEDGLTAAGRKMQIDKKAELFVTAYELMNNPANTKEGISKLIRILA